MTKTILLIMALLAPCSAFAVQPDPGPGTNPGLSSQPQQAETELLQVASAAAEQGLSKGLEVAAADLQDVEEPADTDDAFDLKLPEEDLPDSDIPLTFNSKVEYFTRYFQNSARGSFAKWLSRSERYIPMMRSVLKKEGLPEDLVYLAMIESGFSPHAFSVASAVGPWQFMSATGKRYSLRIDSWIDERRDPLKSTVAAALYLKELYAMFNKDWYLAAAGYNAGENKILRAINMYNSRDFWELSKGEYLKRETKDYVPKLLAAAIIAKEPAKYGFADVAYLPAIEFDVVKIPSRTDLGVVAKACGVSILNIRELNPELRRPCTPPDYPGYELKIPKGARAQFLAEYAKVPEGERYTERVTNVQYRVKRKDTLASIARRFKTTPQSIAELNNLGKKERHLKGRLLTIPVQLAASEGERPLQVAAQEAEHAAHAEKPQAKVQQKSPAKLAQFNKYYIVKKGDTLTSLARRFNVTARILSAWNNLKTRVALKPGKRIIIAKYQERKGAMAQESG
jgi:membrane-bound lytic murein transglycosylase D